MERDHLDATGPMGCDDVAEALSAAADGELAPRGRVALDEHLRGCADCTLLSERLERLDRRLRVRPIDAVPDLVDSVLARAGSAALGRGAWMRPALAWVAVVMVIQNAAPLVLGETEGADTHLARHLGAFGVSLAIGFAYVAWRPHRARGLLPFVAALVVSIVAGTVLDLLDGDRAPLAETAHLPELVGLALLWMVAGSPGLERLGPLRRRWRVTGRAT